MNFRVEKCVVAKNLSLCKNLISLETIINQFTFNNILGQEISIPTADVLFVKANGKYCKFYFLKGNEIASSNANINFKKCAENSLIYPIFYKIHKSYIVNLLHLQNYGTYPGNNMVINVLNSEYIIPISRKKKLDFHNYWNKYKKSII